jgi:hypothetical protein
MDKYKNEHVTPAGQSVFDQYPWAANHDCAITWLTNYMDEKPEAVIKLFDERILQKVAKDHLILPSSFCFA